jgi:Na+-driven multidrug efflux pump
VAIPIKNKSIVVEADLPLDTIFDRAYSILNLAVPSCLYMAMRAVVNFINLMFSGHLKNQLMLAGMGLANMTNTVAALSIMVGFNSVLTTLISQAKGAG